MRSASSCRSRRSTARTSPTGSVARWRSWRTGWRRSWALEHDAAFHHEHDVLQRLDVVERIPADGDDVGELRRREGATIADAEKRGGGDRGGADRVGRFHSELYHRRELARVEAVRKHARIGAERDLHSGVERRAKTAPRENCAAPLRRRPRL